MRTTVERELSQMPTPHHLPRRWPLAASLLALLAAASPARALDHITIRTEGRQKKLSGHAVVEAADGLLLKTRDGAHHRILTTEIVEQTKDDDPFALFDAKQLAEQLLSELPDGFQVHQSKNYVICYNTTRTYAVWTSTLLERLQKAFIAHWKRSGCEVAPPEHPLAVLVFSDQESYADWARAELGPAVNNVIGYYNLDSNRITMYDLTGMQSIVRDEYGRGQRSDINDLLSTPAAEPLVATIVHEATHQISFNCGLQARLVDNPLWMSEGLALYFDTPDLGSSRSWSGIGKVNYARWDRFVENLDMDRVPPLTQLVANDDLFRHPETAVDCYAQSWAWNYFLIKWKPKQYAAYLKDVAKQQLLSQPDPKLRLAMFRRHFGDDFATLEDDFFRQMSRIE
jgi:hypothetical protein